MKTWKRNQIMHAFATVMVFAAIVYMTSQIHYLKLEQAQLKTYVMELQQTMTDSEIEINTDYRAFTFSDEVSFALSIISVGISVFAIFGGILSIVNIYQYKQMDRAIEVSEKAVEYLQELECSSLIQEGRMYLTRERQKYAENCFKRAMTSAPESYMALVAEYELFALHADVWSSWTDKKKQVQDEFKRLLEKFKGMRIDKDRRYKELKGDIYFLMGCVYGKYSLSEHGGDNLKKSEKYMENAIRCDKKNADFYRNMANTYALMENKEM